VLAIEAQSRQCNLHDQNRALGMCITVVARIASHDTEVRFRLRLFVESDGELLSHGPSLTECAIDGAKRELDRGGAGTVLRLLEEHITAEQLDTVLGAEDLELGGQRVRIDTPSGSVDSAHHAWQEERDDPVVDDRAVHTAREERRALLQDRIFEPMWTYGRVHGVGSGRLGLRGARIRSNLRPQT
jgi:hypothetical protein